MRSLILSQCRDLRIGVTREVLRCLIRQQQHDDESRHRASFILMVPGGKHKPDFDLLRELF